MHVFIMRIIQCLFITVYNVYINVLFMNIDYDAFSTNSSHINQLNYCNGLDYNIHTLNNT